MLYPSRRIIPTQTAASYVCGVVVTLGASIHFDPAEGVTENSTTSWVDCINGYTVSTTEDSGRLLYNPSLVSLNGLPGWEGNSSPNSKLSSTNSFITNLFSNQNPYTLICINKHIQGSKGTLVSASGANSSISHNIEENGEHSIERSAQSAIGSANLSSLMVSTWLFDGTLSKCFINGILQYSTTNNASLSLDSFCIGNNNQSTGFQGFIGDIVIFPKDLSDSDRNRAESLLAVKYAI